MWSQWLWERITSSTLGEVDAELAGVAENGVGPAAGVEEDFLPVAFHEGREAPFAEAEAIGDLGGEHGDLRRAHPAGGRGGRGRRGTSAACEGGCPPSSRMSRARLKVAARTRGRGFMGGVFPGIGLSLLNSTGRGVWLCRGCQMRIKLTVTLCNTDGVDRRKARWEWRCLTRASSLILITCLRQKLSRSPFARRRRSASAIRSLAAELDRVRAMSVEDRIKAALSLRERFAWLQPAPADKR